mmetsp:Transcript_3206/g.5789  ORF Transcript_3206/g.5789 Transcript_3206/m.5789 type:complete len:239 (-) Transcript_3206:779-1495(-)
MLPKRARLSSVPHAQLRLHTDQAGNAGHRLGMCCSRCNQYPHRTVVGHRRWHRLQRRKNHSVWHSLVSRQHHLHLLHKCHNRCNRCPASNTGAHHTYHLWHTGRSRQAPGRDNYRNLCNLYHLRRSLARHTFHLMHSHKSLFYVQAFAQRLLQKLFDLKKRPLSLSYSLKQGRCETAGRLTSASGQWSQAGAKTRQASPRLLSQTLLVQHHTLQPLRTLPWPVLLLRSKHDEDLLATA